MQTSAVIEYFGGVVAVAKALGIKPPSVSQWGETVPKLRQLQVEALTGGKLKADASILSPAIDAAPTECPPPGRAAA